MHTINKINENFNNYLPTFKPFSGSHAGENLRRELKDVMATFNIVEKLICEVYFEPEDEDEQSSEKEELQSKEQRKEIIIDEQEERLRIPCFAHTLQLTVGDGLRNCSIMKSAIEKIVSIVELR